MLSSTTSRDAPQSLPSARFFLKAETTEAHERLDGLYSRLDLARPDDYALFLRGHAAAFLPVEAALCDAGADDLVAGWSDTLRGADLVQDLADLDLTLPAPVVAPVFASPAAVLGGLYVLEGSRLGGAMLARSVGPGLPRRFLAPGNAGAWRAFTTLMDAKLQSCVDQATAARAATDVFDLFEQSARPLLEPTARDT